MITRLNEIKVTQLPDREETPKETFQAGMRGAQGTEELVIILDPAWTGVEMIDLETFKMSSDA